MDRLEAIEAKLTRLAQLDASRRIFGSDAHDYRQNAKLKASDIAAFESKHAVCLPEEYRAWLLRIANGGAGPFYGLMPLEENDGHAPLPNHPFPFTREHPFRMDAMYAEIEAATAGLDDDASDETQERIFNQYCARADSGITYLAHEGCGMYSVLVINGPEYGHVWFVDLANDAGAFPLADPGTGAPLGFLDWFERWLDAALARITHQGAELTSFIDFIPPDCPLFIADADEYENLKATLSSGKPVSATDAERLAFTLSRHCARYLVNQEIEPAGVAIDLIFRCFRTLPYARHSQAVHAAFHAAALRYIEAADDPTAIKTGLVRLVALSSANPTDQALRRTAASASICPIIFYLNAEPTEKPAFFSFVRKKTPLEHARQYYAALETFVEPYLTNDSTMPAALARAKREFVSAALKNGEAPDFHRAALRDLADFAKKYAHNPLVAAEYADACYLCFQSDRNDHSLIVELERTARANNARYDALAQSEGKNHASPGYTVGKIDFYFLSAEKSLAAHLAETNDKDKLLTEYERLRHMTYAPERAADYLAAKAQLLSNLSYVYGNAGDFSRAEDAVSKLRALAEHAKTLSDDDASSLDALSDALYNLVTSYAESDTVQHARRMDALIEELKSLADKTDEFTQHTRYASALYNAYINAPDEAQDDKLLDRLYAYAVLQHGNLSDLLIENLALAEAGRITAAGKTGDLKAAREHREHVKVLTEGTYYGDRMLGDVVFPSRADEIQAASAVADFNLLTVAGDNGDPALAKAMLCSLSEMANAYPNNKGVILRLAKGALNLVIDSGNAGNIEEGNLAYQTMLPAALSCANDPEIANQLVTAAYYLSAHLILAKKDYARVTALYQEIKHAKPNGDAAARLTEMSIMAGAS